MGYSEKDIFVVILAGGQGTRFWPISRAKRPKQFLSLAANGESLISATARRVGDFSRVNPPLVVSNVLHRELILEHVPGAMVLCEPEGRNTSASIGLAAQWIQKQNPNAIMIVLPADHAVSDEQNLVHTLGNAIALAQAEELLVTIGIEPKFPHTGYGYIKRGAKLAHSGFMISRFFEKPSLERAKSYYESGEFYWNSGMFVWRVDSILAAFKEYMPELAAGLDQIGAALGSDSQTQVISEVFPKLESISVDFGVLEHARNCAVVSAGDFGWTDVGSWDAWAEFFEKDSEGNLQKGDTLLVESQGCVVYSEKKFTAVLGAKDLVIIDSGDALLVCPRERVQDVRGVVDELKQKGRTELI